MVSVRFQAGNWQPDLFRLLQFLATIISGSIEIVYCTLYEHTGRRVSHQRELNHHHQSA
jgi:hypothetical protein